MKEKIKIQGLQKRQSAKLLPKLVCKVAIQPVIATK